MQSKSTQLARIIFGIMVLMLALFTGKPTNVYADQSVLSIEDAIYTALERVTPKAKVQSAKWAILELAQNADWGVAKAILEDKEALIGFEIVIAYREDGHWEAVTQFDREWNKALSLVTDDVLPYSFREMLPFDFVANSTTTIQSDKILAFPFCGKAMVWQGHHTINNIDFISLTDQDLEIRAPETGIVVFLEYKHPIGVPDLAHTNRIIMKHADGFYSEILHLKTNSVPQNIINAYHDGTIILKGTVLGIEGETGKASGPHIHIEVHTSFENAKGAGKTDIPFSFANKGNIIPSSQLKQYDRYDSSNCGDESPPDTAITSSPPPSWSNGDQPILFQWNGTDNQTSANQLLFSYRLKDTDPWSALSANKSVEFKNLPDGDYKFQVKAYDQSYLEDASPAEAPFGIDRLPPTQPVIKVSGSGCYDSLNGEPQNTCRDPDFTWSSTDRGSGVKALYYYWGTDPAGKPDKQANGVNPPAISQEFGHASYFLNVQAVDNMDRRSSIASFAVLYDKEPPNAIFTINRDSEETYQVNVTLHAVSDDEGSGLARARISNNQTYWSDWLPYQEEIPWLIPAQDNRTYTVYMQVADRAGNVSEVLSDTIRLNLNPPAPHSLNFRLCQTGVTSGGSFGLADSPSYRLDTVFGQPIQQMQLPPSGPRYQLKSGFWAVYPGCLPIESTDIFMGYTIRWYSLNAGGSSRSTPLYQLTDTLGQPFVSQTAQMQSASYELTSGFLANADLGAVPGDLVGDVPSRSGAAQANTDEPPPTVSDMDLFQISIDEGRLFANTAEVKLKLDAPFGVRMKIWNGEPADPEPSGAPILAETTETEDDWIDYQDRIFWTINITDPLVKPRAVYFLVETVDGHVLGPFRDEILFDPIPPQAEIEVHGSDSEFVLLEMIAIDENSGVSQVRIGSGPELGGVDWLAFDQEYYEWNIFNGDAYVQFMDQAGNVSQIYRVGFGGESVSPNYIYLPIIRR